MRSNTFIEDLIAKCRVSQVARNEVIMDILKIEKLEQSVRRFILKNGGNNEDAHDIHVDAILKFIESASTKSDFKIHTTLESYLFGIAKNLWYKRFNKRIKKKTESLEIVQYKESAETDPEQLLDDAELKEGIEQALNNLGKNCKEVLKLWMQGASMKEIAEKVNYKSEGMARKKKCNCLKQLTDFLENHPDIAAKLKEE